MTLSKRQLQAQHQKRDEKGRFCKLPITIAPSTHIEHVYTFRGIPNQHSKTYSNPDEAIRNNPANARAMRKDAFIMECLRSRQYATAQLDWHLEPENRNDPEQVHATEVLTQIIENIPQFLKLKMALLEAIWFGRYGVCLDYNWDFSRGAKRMVVNDWRPLHGDKLIFGWNLDDSPSDDLIGYLTNASTRHDRPIVTTRHGLAEIIDECDRQALIIHKHEIEDGSFEEPEVAGSLHGIGIRSRIYWAWWHKQELLAWLFELLERFGMGGFQVWYFEQGNPASETAVRAAAEAQSRNNILLFPRPAGDEKQTTGLEFIEPKGSGIDQFLKLIDDYFGSVIKRYICGQTLTSDTAPTGMGSGVAEGHANTFQRIVKFDASNLQETITNQLVDVLLKYNFPDANFKIKFNISVEKPNPKEFLEAAQILYNMGGAIDADEIRKMVGLTKPEANRDILQKIEEKIPDENAVEHPENISDDAIESQEALAASNLQGSVGALQTIKEMLRDIKAGEIEKDSAVELVIGFTGLSRDIVESIFNDADNTGNRPTEEGNPRPEEGTDVDQEAVGRD